MYVCVHTHTLYIYIYISPLFIYLFSGQATTEQKATGMFVFVCVLKEKVPEDVRCLSDLERNTSLKQTMICFFIFFSEV